jgi:hypothetical protein
VALEKDGEVIWTDLVKNEGILLKSTGEGISLL